MPNPSTSKLPKPKSWDEFEDIIWEIYTRKWQDSHAERYGRHGQSQHGVDIYGKCKISNNYVAIQCKFCDNKTLNLKVIKDEIIKTKTFPSVSLINEYLIVTTESRSKELQDTVRTINESRKPEKNFSVYVIFWEDICNDLANPNNHDLLRKYYSEWGQIFSDRHSINQQKNDNKFTSIRQLLILEIEQDCYLLQEILNRNTLVGLSKKWQQSFKKNRSIWQDITSRMILSQSAGELVRRIQDFYTQLDNIEVIYQNILIQQSEIQQIDSKPRYGGGTLSLQTMHPPTWSKEYFTVKDELELLTRKKFFDKKNNEFNQNILMTLNVGKQVIHELK